MDDNLIVKCVGGLYTVVTSEGKRIECRAKGTLRRLDPPPAPGDRVTLENGVISTVLPRKNVIIRPFIANIDKLFIVSAVADPDPDCYFTDKLIAIAEFSGIEPILVFSKTDLGVAGISRNYDGLPHPKYFVSTKTGEGIEDLSREFAGCVSAFAGLSGVGKSSIVNALCKFSGVDAVSEVGALSEKISRGKNTTRHTELFPLCGGYIADTPGFGSIEPEYFGLFDRSLLIDCFSDFSDYIGDCEFSDCRHIKERNCGIKKAVAEGCICKDRYESFVRMFNEMGEYKPWENNK